MCPKIVCDCGEEKWITVTEDIGKAVDMLEWLVHHWQAHKFLNSETDLNVTFTVKTPAPEVNKE